MFSCILFLCWFEFWLFLFFFFKQKTAYEMRISDWSSDVCSSDLDIVHCDFILIDDAGEEIGLSRVGPVDRLLHGNNVGACFLYRARVTEALGGYDTGLFGVEDYDFWLRAARRFTFVTLHEDLYLYRKHGGRLTRRDRKSNRLN